ncbi:hypothetical protein SAMN04487965_3617 [Microbulbifer donghaiensis]|uniref:Uncharacterized protein n=1 Tax=Microbulbifer donghaiensis TaxID=494016 RepID=A0A1M5I9U1_9GAMM|nr:hypothetical protein [Microbulbifer donghaiensis]SHG24995.1 hypothetical protein SAMN04487965_3617 [Microbulbifer donghaiensis]
MRQFSILVIFVLAFGGAAVLYEKESRKVKGVLAQITELQAQLGDLQAEVNRLNGELEAVKLAERRRPNLKTIASRIHTEDRPAVINRTQARSAEARSHQLIASDVTSAPPAIHGRGEDETVGDSEWNRPTVDAEQYQRESADESGSERAVADPYQ